MFSWLWRGKAKDDKKGAGPAAEPTRGDLGAPTPQAPGDGGHGTRPAVVSQPDATLDYLATPEIAAYFDAREHEAYYRSLKRVGPRRDFHERLIATLERFVELTETPQGASSVDRVMAFAHQRRAAEVPGTVLRRALAEQPRGVELLGLVEPASYVSLKTAYRSAARRHHPDTGGDHEAMVAVNNAFALVHSLLREEQIGGGEAGAEEFGLGVGVDANTCADYRYVCGELLFLATLDDWNVDTAATWLERITSREWQRSQYARATRQHLALTEPSGRLATRLAGIQRAEAARRAAEVAKASLRIAKAEGLLYDHYVPDIEAILAGTKRTQVTVSHSRQAKHALRLGAIDERRYAKALEKQAVEADKHESDKERLVQLQGNGGFLQDLPTDRVSRGKVVKSSLVPEPGYYVTRIADLTDDQQAEYVRAFGSAASLAMVRKYLFVRLVSLLESVLLHPGAVDAESVAREAAALGSLHDGTGTAYATEVTAAIRVVAEQDLSERRERARLLTAVESGTGRAGGGMQISLGGSPLGTPLSDSYMKAILRPLSDLLVLQRQGAFPVSTSERQDRDAYNRDLEVLDSPVVAASEEAAWAAADIAKADPARAVVVWAQHCEALLRIGASMENVQELQLGYWVDRLTAALVRLKRSDEALAWLVRYFDLPSRYRDRSSSSEDEGMRKRMERCRTKVSAPH